MSIDERIHKYVTPEPNSGCWLWIGCVSDSGYALLQISGRVTRVHKFLYERRHGRLPHGHVVRHKCDVNCCVNPDHMTPGTQLQNVMDTVIRGRHRVGVRMKDHRLTEEKVRAIRVLHVNGWSFTRIGKLFSVNRWTVSRVVNGKRWSHI